MSTLEIPLLKDGLYSSVIFIIFILFFLMCEGRLRYSHNPSKKYTILKAVSLQKKNPNLN